MTEITAPKSPVTAEQFADEIREQLKYTQNVTTEQATPADVYVAASKAVRNHLADSWFKTQADTVNGNTKAVGYLSAEFLMGKQLRNALLNAGLTEQFDKAVEALGFKPKDIVDAEYEPGLGNGGLGRLAACFIDSLASLGVAAYQTIAVRLAGALTLSQPFIAQLMLLKRTCFALGMILISPPLLLFALCPQGTGGVWFCIIAVELAAAAVLYLKETLNLFLSKKVSILHWFLYLCTVEVFPVSLLWLLAVR